MEEEKILEYDANEFPDEAAWESLKAEIEAQYTPEDGEDNGENC